MGRQTPDTSAYGGAHKSCFLISERRQYKSPTHPSQCPPISTFFSLSGFRRKEGPHTFSPVYSFPFCNNHTCSLPSVATIQTGPPLPLSSALSISPPPPSVRRPIHHVCHPFALLPSAHRRLLSTLPRLRNELERRRRRRRRRRKGPRTN